MRDKLIIVRLQFCKDRNLTKNKDHEHNRTPIFESECMKVLRIKLDSTEIKLSGLANLWHRNLNKINENKHVKHEPRALMVSSSNLALHKN
jgi:hypothetical protein